MLKTFLLSLCLLSSSGYAKDKINWFIKSEFNQDDRITGIGSSVLLHDSRSAFKGEIVYSFNHAEVLDKQNHFQQFMSLDIGTRVGYYNNIFVYVEAGVDALELFVNDKGDKDLYYDDDEDNDIDVYAGIGAGVDTGQIRIEGFAKFRRLDSELWESEHHLFYGAQFSITF